MNVWQYLDKHPVWTLVYLLIIATAFSAPLIVQAIVWRKKL